MDWNDITKNPLLIENYSLVEKMGLFDFINFQKKEIRGTNNLLDEAYELFQKESVSEIIDYVLWCLSDKFIPSSVYVILNEGVMVNKIKTIAFRNMQAVDEEIPIHSLKPFRIFFKKHTGTISFSAMKNEIDQDLLKTLELCQPEIVVPIVGLSGLFGIILFGPKILGEEYSPKEISYINHLMKFTSVCIQNSIHYNNSVKDSKTGLYNHNFFLNRLKEEIARSKRNHGVFSVMIMDIDRFKHFNDTYGHLAGDEVLNKLAQTLEATKREEDTLSRFGGEEFTILLPDTEPRQSWYAAERCRKAVEAMETTYQGHSLKVTISVGIASVHPYSLGTAEDLISRADKALYKSKEKGRNQTTHYRSGLLHQVLEPEG